MTRAEEYRLELDKGRRVQAGIGQGQTSTGWTWTKVPETGQEWQRKGWNRTRFAEEICKKTPVAGGQASAQYLPALAWSRRSHFTCHIVTLYCTLHG